MKDDVARIFSQPYPQLNEDRASPLLAHTAANDVLTMEYYTAGRRAQIELVEGNAQRPEQVSQGVDVFH